MGFKTLQRSARLGFGGEVGAMGVGVKVLDLGPGLGANLPGAVAGAANAAAKLPTFEFGLAQFPPASRPPLAAFGGNAFAFGGPSPPSAAAPPALRNGGGTALVPLADSLNHANVAVKYAHTFGDETPPLERMYDCDARICETETPMPPASLELTIISSPIFHSLPVIPSS